VPGSSDGRLANLLGAVATGLNDEVSDAAAAAELDVRAATALVAMLDFTPSGSVNMLSQVVGLTHAGTVRLVNRLVAAGHVERSPGRDLRTVSVKLTPKGRTVARQIRRQRHTAIRAVMAGLPEDQRERLEAACELLIANLTKQRLARRASGTRPAGGALCRMCDFDACGRPVGRCPAAAAAQADQERRAGERSSSGRREER
jgi:DNA-binding MarR family transcriptional regulator